MVARGIRQYYRGMHGFILLFDLSSVESFSNVSRWLDEIDQHGSMEQGARGARDPNHFRGVLLGNKTDLVGDSDHSTRLLQFHQAKRLAADRGMSYRVAFPPHHISLA
jgi:GTPase SAR1 family protein